MIISVQRGMDGIKSYLENKGYRVVYADEYPHPPDAYIYNDFSQYVLPDAFENPFFSGISAVSTSNSSAGRYPGAVNINAAGRCFGDIEQMILYTRKGGLI